MTPSSLPPFGDRAVPWRPVPSPRALVVVLHGYGSTGQITLDRVVDTATVAAAPATFVAPDGPEPSRFRPGGRQWYPITNRTATAVERSRAPGLALRRWVQTCQQELDLKPVSTVVVGFSQGGIMAEALLEPPSLAANSVVLAAAAGRFDDVESDVVRTYVVGADDRYVPRHDLETAVTSARARGARVPAVVEIAGLGHDMSDESLSYVRAAIDTLVHADATVKSEPAT